MTETISVTYIMGREGLSPRKIHQPIKTHWDYIDYPIRQYVVGTAAINGTPGLLAQILTLLSHASTCPIPDKR